ncbi:hypothetical protein SAY86_010744 [Trapa natans]|uniref:Dof zinc finger protein n=1 Tax=Trapa natans TaxID=22666 RepID=A0AAN7LIT7_TRANT|nr:hypothetical protein SAY86_010744 [Trapa natans]
MTPSFVSLLLEQNIPHQCLSVSLPPWLRISLLLFTLSDPFPSLSLVLLSTTAPSSFLQDDRGSLIDDQEILLMASSTGRRLPMEKPNQQSHEQQQQLQQQNQQPLKCPRCESSNTKFCYYNNYSLSQPRHFCKACKRYWTRGGTLRNVPVGGGCRKNKRIKRPSSSSSTTTASAAIASEPHQTPVMARSSIDVSTARSTAHVNPLFFDMGSGISYPRFHSAVDLPPPHLPGVLGLGFAPPGFGCGDNNYIQDLVSSAPVFSGGNYSSDGIQCTSPSMIPPILASAAPTATISSAVPTISSLLASTFQQQKLYNADLKDVQAPGNFKGFSSFQDSRDTVNAENDITMKEVKAEGLNLPGWSFGYQNQMDISGSVPHYWNMSSSSSAWHDPSNTGSSVPSLI